MNLAVAVIAAIVANDGCRVIAVADARHLILITFVVLDDRAGALHANADTGATVTVTFIASQDRFSSFALADAGADVLVTHVVNNQRAGVATADGGAQVLKPDVLLDGGRGTVGRTDSAPMLR